MINNTSLVIVNYNNARKLINDAGKIFHYFKNVVIVDNGSTDDSFLFLKEICSNKSNVTIIHQTIAKGFAVGTNVGLRYVNDNIKSKYILCMSYDIICSIDLIQRCYHEMENKPELGLISARMIEQNGKEGTSCWKFPNYWHLLGLNFRCYRKRKPNNISYKYDDCLASFSYVDVVRGSFLFLRAEAVRKVDYLDERTYLYFEENILCDKLNKAGYKVGIILDDSYIHNHVYVNGKMVVSFNNYKENFKSMYVYIKYYLKVNLAKLILFKICSGYNIFQQYLISTLKKKV